jgi:regulator of sigma E protease
MEILQTIFYFIVVIFALVSVHEFGHFIAARMFGIWVPVYSIGMGKRLFGFNKLNGFTFGELPESIEEKLGVNTDYRLSLLPIGGYAKIHGMIDETQTEEMTGPVQPNEYRSKSWWKKSIVITAGVIMNFILAGAIYIGLKYSEGKEIWETTTIGYVKQNSVSEKLGVQKGDKIVAVSGTPVSDWGTVREEIIVENLERDFTLTVNRAGEQKTFAYKLAELGNYADDPRTFEQGRIGLFPEGMGGVRIDADPVATLPADKIGLKKGDVITRINDVVIDNPEALVDNISANADKEITIYWTRNGQEMSSPVTPGSDGKIGIQPVSEPFKGKIRHENYSIFEAVSVGIDELFTQTRLYIKSLVMLFTGRVDVSKSLGGPIKIAQYASKSAEGGATYFLQFMAILSLSLAFLNLLPIPALDGGHLIIILVEAVMRRELSQKVKIGIQRVGVTVLLALMVFMLFNDIRGL